MKLPNRVNICGIEYSITYCDNPAEVDRSKRRSLWGQIDYWERSIRVYANGRGPCDIWQTILHEVIHGIVTDLHMSKLEGDDAETEVDVLALALVDVLTRNGWWDIEREAA